MTQRPPIPDPPYHGGCLCGQVRWTLTERPKALNACHCTDCKISTGSTHIEMLIAAAEAFSSTGETHTFIKTAASGRQLEIHRCANCGTRMFHYNTVNRALVFIPAAIGIQEAGYAALVPLFGLAPETGLAISILRRARDIAVGVPVLLIWQLVEARRARR